MTNFHPDAQWLSEYVAGTLADSEALCVSTHLSYCEQCNNETASLMQFGAALFDSQPDTDSGSAAALQQVFTNIGNKTPDSPNDASTSPEITSGDEQLPHAVQKLINRNTTELNWRNIGNKISIAKLNELGDTREITLHKLQPGSSVSDHDHRGREITVVLSGSFFDDDGQYFPGDFLIREPGETHQPKVNSDEECLCLAVCDAPVKFTGLFTRLLNPLIAFQHNR